MKFKGILPIISLAAAVIGIQLALCALNKAYFLTQLTMSVYYAIVVLGLCILMGYAGQASLGHGAFFALGGYTSAILTTHNFANFAQSRWCQALQSLGLMTSKPGLYDGAQLITFTPGAAFVAAMLITLLVAALIGYPALRLKGHYLAMATLGFGLIIYRLLLGSSIAGFADGINGVPPLDFGFGLTVMGGNEKRVVNYYLAWAVCLGVLILLLNLVNSRIGRAWRAIHDGELAANAMGINTANLKLLAFLISAVLAACAGCFLTHYNEGIGPSESSALKSVRYVALVAVGGMANLWGALILSILLNFLSLRGYFGTFDNAVFGALLILIISVAPEGPLKPLGNWLAATWQYLAKGGKEHHDAA